VEARFSAPAQTGPGTNPASCTMGTGSLPGVKSGRGVTLTPQPFLVPWSMGRDISVGIATGYGLDGPGIESRWRRNFPHLPRPVLGPSQPPVQRLPGFSPGVKSGRVVTLTPHPLLVPWSRKSRAIPLLPLLPVLPVQSLSASTTVHFTLHATL